MERLSDKWLSANRPGECARPTREAVIQFGEGNFLRAFVDQMLDQANRAIDLNAGVAVVQPISRGMGAELNAQDGLYTLILRGVVAGQKTSEARVIRSVKRLINPYEDFDAFLALARSPEARFVASNTTEAGIAYTGEDRLDDAPPASFPGKVTRLLWERYNAFGGDRAKGLIFLCCELIDDNGAKLREYVEKYAALWELPGEFVNWLRESCLFLNTLVDRIVTGYPRAEAEAMCGMFGYEDKLIDTGEPFGLWVIECPESVRGELPLDRAGCPVIFTRDVTPYKKRKVRMLNGAHTTLVAAGLLSGADAVGECMADPLLRAFVERALYNEIIPCLTLPKDELEAFAKAMFERFENPFNRHLLSSIALNSASKFAARVLPSIKAYVEKYGRPPICLMAGFAALISLYCESKTNAAGKRVYARGDQEIEFLDDERVFAAFDAAKSADAAASARAIAADAAVWGEDLTLIPGFADEAARIAALIAERGMRAALEALI